MAPTSSRRERRRIAGRTSSTRDDTCAARGDSAADGQPDRSAQGPARAARGGRAARGQAASTSRSTSSARPSARSAKPSATPIVADAQRSGCRRRRRAAWRRSRSTGCCRRYRHYDVFVLPTLPGEGIPRVLLEAMAAGLPVVTTDVSGIASLVTARAERPADDEPAVRLPLPERLPGCSTIRR